MEKKYLQKVTSNEQFATYYDMSARCSCGTCGCSCRLTSTKSGVDTDNFYGYLEDFGAMMGG